MAFFNDISKKISATSQNVMHKAKGFVDVTGLKAQISEEEKKIERYYQSLGKMYYEMHDAQAPGDLKELMSMIDESFAQIAKIKAEIVSIENTRRCPACGALLEEDMVFCVGCGTKVKQEETNTKQCIKCGCRLPAEAVFCTRCGAKQELREENPAEGRPEDGSRE